MATRPDTDERTRRDPGADGGAPGEDRDGANAGRPIGRTGGEIAPRSSILAEAFDLLVRERQSSAFQQPAPLTRPSGMANTQQFEAFRELRTRLMLMAAGVGLKHFTTMVVGLSEGAGASFVARNLAAAFTLQQRIALLVDCNFRNATQREALGPGDDVDGLFDFLGEPEPPVARLIRPTAIPGLHVIPAGSSRTALAHPRREDFSSMPMRTLMSRLRDEPCYVVLDGPPVRGSPDARILSDLADFVVLVVGYGRTSASDIAKAAAVFDRTKFAGVVFNEFGDASRRGATREQR